MKNDRAALEQLLERAEYGLPGWTLGRGRIPTHYKKLDISPEEAVGLAKLGQQKIFEFFGDKLYFSQALFAGAILSRKYTDISAVTPSQYGKSWLLARVLLILAYEGDPVFVACATQHDTTIIMNHMIRSLGSCPHEVTDALLNKKDQIERMQTSTSKQRLAFSGRGSVEAITLAATFGNLLNNQAIGLGGHYFIDEAAKISDDVIAETGRSEFAQLGEGKYMTVQISNPHQPGAFYESLFDTEDEDHFVLWMDALTAVEETRWSKEKVLKSKFAKNKRQRTVYLFCELDEHADSMYETPMVYEGEQGVGDKTYFLGVDSATTGKDNVCVALLSVDEDNMMRIERIQVIDTRDWEFGVTNKQVCDEITMIARAYGVAMIAVDTANGVWLVNMLEEKHLPVRNMYFQGSVNKDRRKAGHYASVNGLNKRAELHLDMQNLIEERGIAFHKDAYAQIKDVLPHITYKRMEGSGKVKIRNKNEIKVMLGRSPDEWDSCLLSLEAYMILAGETFIDLTNESREE